MAVATRNGCIRYTRILLPEMQTSGSLHVHLGIVPDDLPRHCYVVSGSQRTIGDLLRCWRVDGPSVHCTWVSSDSQ